MATAKKVTLIAKTLVSYGGKNHGQNMQFDAAEADVDGLVKSGQAELAPTRKEAAEAAAAPAGKK